VGHAGEEVVLEARSPRELLVAELELGLAGGELLGLGAQLFVLRLELFVLRLQLLVGPRDRPAERPVFDQRLQPALGGRAQGHVPGVRFADVGASDPVEELADVDPLQAQRHVVLLEAADQEEVFHHLLDLRRRFLRGLEGLLEVLMSREAPADPGEVEVDDGDRVLEVVDDELGELALLAVEPLQRVIAPHELVARLLESEQRAHASEEDRPIHRLFEELVGACLEPPEARFALGLPRDEDDRNVRWRRERAHMSEDVDTVEIGHQDVEQNEVGRPSFDRQDGLSPADCPGHLMTEGRQEGFE